MKFKIFIIKILAILFGLSAKAQYLEIGAFGGGSHFIGDVGNYGLHLPRGYAYGGFVKYNFNRRWGLKASVNYGYITNADSLSTYDYRVNRNLHFRTHILEASITAEFHFLTFEPGSKYNHTPYIFGGVGIFRFNPTTDYMGEEYELQPLGTEGQATGANSDVPYSLREHFWSFGIGYKWAIGDFTSIGVESRFRSTDTDYLDDVSGFYADPEIVAEAHGPVAAALSDRSISGGDKEDHLRGNPQTKDWYIFTGVTIQFKFDDLYEKCASFVGG